MVKGISRRVIVIKSPDPKFEQAIFIVRDEVFQGGVSADQVLRDAQQIADGYVRRNAPLRKKFRLFSPAMYIALGALGATVLWYLMRFF